MTWGSLLGTYVLGGLWRRARQRDVIIAMVAGVLIMTPIVLPAVIPRFPERWHWLPGLAWPWYVPLGTAVTVAVGMLSSLLGRPDGWTGGQPTVPA